jgi:hypothetical protein
MKDGRENDAELVRWGVPGVISELRAKIRSLAIPINASALYITQETPIA